MQLAKGAVRLHLLDCRVYHLQQVLLTFLHQHANLAVSERLVQQRGCKPGILLHIIGSLGNLRNHHIGLPRRYALGYLLILRVDGDPGLLQVRSGKLFIQSARIHHDEHVGLVNIGERLVSVALRCPAQNGLPVGQIALAHEHGLAPGVGDGDTANGKVEQLRLCQHVGSQRRP